jgi:uncharacterized protein YacL
MNCYTSGILGLGMLFATYSTVSISDQEEKRLLDIFPPELDKIYIQIAKERANIYFQGLILGLIASYLLISLLTLTNPFHKATFFLAITLVTSVLYYFIAPKSDYMLNHLKTQEQNKAWLEVYKNMQKKYITGFIIGCLSAIPISYAVC